MVATKSRAVYGFVEGPVSRSRVPFSMRTFVGMAGDATASPTPFKTSDGTIEVKRLPMEYMMHEEFLNASITLGLAGIVISWPYGLMYHSRSILDGSSSSSSFENAIAGLRSVGKVPGMLASSTLSLSSVSVLSRCRGEDGVCDTSAVGALGWLILFWPVMTVPSTSPVAMWWAKLVFRTGRIEIVLGTPQMLETK